MNIYLRIRKGNLSQKSLEKGRVKKNSLYLMYHNSNTKKREYEFLKLYVFDKPKTELQKKHNKETLQLAEAIKSQRILDNQSRNHGFISSVRGKIGFLTYFKSLVDKRINSDGNYGNWSSTYNHLKLYCKNVDIELEKVDEIYLEGFKNYLLNEKISIRSRNKNISQNSALSYFNKVKTALKEAYQSKFIKENPCLRVRGIKEKDTNRKFLTIEELRLLSKTECKCEITKKAFIFSALTGLRFSDIQALKWNNIIYDASNGWFINYRQKKTDKTEVLPISKEALNILGERRTNIDLVFEGLVYSAYKNKQILEWVYAAGINKHITFHSGRHSYACALISSEVDIYTVSKLLGHSSVKTTEIYAKVIDKKKIAAVSKLPSLLG